MNSVFGISRTKAPVAFPLPESNRDIMVAAKGGALYSSVAYFGWASDSSESVGSSPLY